MSVLDDVLALIDAEKELSTVDIPVPSLQGKVVVRCAETLDLAKATAVTTEQGMDGVVLAAWILAETCVGVFVNDPDGPVGFDKTGSADPGKWPRLDRALGEMLPGLPGEPSAVEICLALFGAGYPAGSGKVQTDLLKAQKAVLELNQFDPKAINL